VDDELTLTLAEIENARERIRRQLPPTPLRRSFALRPHDV